MKLQHHVNYRERQPEPISERYQAEIDKSLRKADRAWRNAERQRVKAEEREARTPSVESSQALERVRAEAERLWLEFQRLDALMRGAPVGSSHSGTKKRARHRTGRDERLEGGQANDR